MYICHFSTGAATISYYTATSSYAKLKPGRCVNSKTATATSSYEKLKPGPCDLIVKLRYSETRRSILSVVVALKKMRLPKRMMMRLKSEN